MAGLPPGRSAGTGQQTQRAPAYHIRLACLNSCCVRSSDAARCVEQAVFMYICMAHIPPLLLGLHQHLPISADRHDQATRAEGTQPSMTMHGHTAVWGLARRVYAGAGGPLGRGRHSQGMYSPTANSRSGSAGPSSPSSRAMKAQRSAGGAALGYLFTSCSNVLSLLWAAPGPTGRTLGEAWCAWHAHVTRLCWAAPAPTFEHVRHAHQ